MMRKQLFTMAAALMLMAGSAWSAPEAPRGGGSYSVPPARFTTADGRTWERIPLRYTDVQAVARMFGAPVLPNEMDIWAMRARGYLGGLHPGSGGGAWQGGYSGGYATSPGANFGFPNSGYPGAPSGYGPGGAFGAGPGIGMGSSYGVPGGSQVPGSFYRAVDGSGVGFLPGNAPNQAGLAAGGRSILGDRNSNSLIVGPGGSGGRMGGPLFPGLIIFGDRNTNSLLVDP